MSFLTKPQITDNIVGPALHKVADFNGDITSYPFQHFAEFHKKVFLSALKLFTNAHEHPTPNKYYDILLNDSLIDEWSTMADCIQYIYDRHNSKDTANRDRL
ncbi:hypothetical protein [Marinoscillum sp.]|uniref:hypothetical protein n=1 Tax=Marinoscillum sp. TaxID=2024838 RepID=UPI003BAB5009